MPGDVNSEHGGEMDLPLTIVIRRAARQSLVLLCAFAPYACDDGARIESSPGPDDVIAAADSQLPAATASPLQLVDSSFIPAAADPSAGGYRQTATADLDGDSDEESVVLIADVEMIDGRPAWDDGQPWRVYVEEDDGTRTYLYAGRIQLGTLTMRIARNESDDGLAIILIEHLPDRLALYEIEYIGAGDVVATQRFRRVLDPRGDIASPRFP